LSTLFGINFRRESYLRELARARNRVLALGAWVAYFGVMAVVLGLYGLNCASLTQRVARLERQEQRARAQAGQRTDWKLTPGQLGEIERYVSNTQSWRDRLEHFAAVMPANARLTSLALNPENLSGPANENKVVMTGQLKLAPGEDRMHGVVELVSALRHDKTISASYRTIRLVSTRTSEAGGPVAEFSIECQP
jgi:hypothetical protein